MPVEPKNKKLYERVKTEAKSRFNAYPSAYASSWIVKTYKSRGGTYKGRKPSPKKGLQRWHNEIWIDVCKLPKIVPCGRKSAKSPEKGRKKYPYCRPYVKVTNKTPKTINELKSRLLKKRCSIKSRIKSRRLK